MYSNVKLLLQKKGSDLGFNIQGGRDKPYIPGDSGIFVSKVNWNGAAYKEGSIKAGDKILSINGKSLANVTQQEAQAYMAQARENLEVNLKVHHGALGAIRANQAAKAKAAGGQNTSGATVLFVALLGLGAVLTIAYIANKKYNFLRR